MKWPGCPVGIDSDSEKAGYSIAVHAFAVAGLYSVTVHTGYLAGYRGAALVVLV